MARTLGLRPPTRNAIALALAGGVVHGAVFPGLSAWPLAFVAVTPLVIAVRGRSAAAGAALGWLAGSIAAGIAVVPWLAESARDFFGVGAVPALAMAVAAGQVFGAMPVAAFGWAAARLGGLRTVVGRVLAIAAAWAATEFARSRLATGLPWDLLAHALAPVPLLVQMADLGGALAVSFVLAACGAAVAECALAPRREARRALALAAGLIAADVGYGALRLHVADPAHAHRVSVALVQGDVPNGWRNDPTRATAALAAYADLTRGVLAERPDLVVWPENAVSVLLDANPRFRAELARTLRDGGAPLVVGAPRAASLGAGRVALFNAAHFVAPDGGVLATYDKRHLVPFAEYRPIGRPRPGDYTPGNGVGVFPWRAPFGVLVCFEVLYPELAREAVGAGAEWLVNVSNDAWFAGAAAREQHFAAVVFRAVELRRPVVRVANAGITAAVDASGRVTARFPTDVAGAWTVRVSPSAAKTVFATTGDLFAWLAVAGVGVALAAARRGA